MLPLILGGLAAYTLLKRNPLRPGKRGAAARRRVKERTLKAYVRALRVVRGKYPHALAMPALPASSSPSQASWQKHAAMMRRLKIKPGRRSESVVSRSNKLWRLARNPKGLSRIYNGLSKALRSKGFKFTLRDATDESVDPHIDLGNGLSLALDNSGWVAGVVKITESPEWVMVDRYWDDDPSVPEIVRRVVAFAAKHGTKSNPKRRRGVTPGGAAARLAQWRWHRNPRTIIDPLTGRRVRVKSGRVLAGGPTRTRRGGIPGVRGADGVWRRPNPVWDIKPGDRVTIRTPRGQEQTGRVVMRGSDGWVLNLGGRSGTPGIATPDNIVRVTRGKRRGATILG